MGVVPGQGFSQKSLSNCDALNALVGQGRRHPIDSAQQRTGPSKGEHQMYFVEQVRWRYRHLTRKACWAG